MCATVLEPETKHKSDHVKVEVTAIVLERWACCPNLLSPSRLGQMRSSIWKETSGGQAAPCPAAGPAAPLGLATASCTAAGPLPLI